MRNPLVSHRVRIITGSFAFIEHLFQVLSLPPEPVRLSRLLQKKKDMERGDPATVHQLIQGGER